MIKQYPHIETERDGPVLIVRLANEAARNSLTREMRFSLRDVVREIADDHTIRSVYLTAKGKTFCAGGDLRMLTEASGPWQSHRPVPPCQHAVPALDDAGPHGGLRRAGGRRRWRHGVGVDGGYDRRRAECQIHGRLLQARVVPDCLTLFTLPRLVGLAKARQFLYANGTWNADEAMTNGIVNQVVADDEVDAAGLELAHRYAKGPAEVMGLSKSDHAQVLREQRGRDDGL